VRRVVTGLNGDGRSCVIFDGVPPARLSATQAGTTAYALWRTAGPQADNGGVSDAAAEPFDIRLEFGATKFLTTCFPPVPDAGELTVQERAQRAREASRVPQLHRTAHAHPGMHATNSVDYVVVVRGELTMVLEEGECLLRAGDVVVDRGVAHAWENRGLEPAVIVVALVDAAPL
jgi:quercetin dioxygenase-like cupin family protein